MGRRPKPAALREAQGNPGRRPIPKEQQLFEGQAESNPPMPSPRKVRSMFSIVKVRADAKRVYDLVAPELRRMNFLRPSDEPAFWRYCDAFARYWRVTAELNRLGGETYECKTDAGGLMTRMRPQFLVQERLAKRLDTLEDRFGLTPMARQQYMLQLQRAPQMLPLDQPPQEAEGTGASPAPGPAAVAARPPVVGSSSLN